MISVWQLTKVKYTYLDSYFVFLTYLSIRETKTSVDIAYKTFPQHTPIGTRQITYQNAGKKTIEGSTVLFHLQRVR